VKKTEQTGITFTIILVISKFELYNLHALICTFQVKSALYERDFFLHYLCLSILPHVKVSLFITIHFFKLIFPRKHTV